MASIVFCRVVKMIHGNQFIAVEEAHQSRVLVRFSSQILETAAFGRGTLVNVINKRAELTEIRSEGTITAEASNDEDSKNSAEIQESQDSNYSQRYKNQRERDTQSKMLLN